MMAAGDRDKLVTIEQLAAPDSAGGSGFYRETWTALGRAWMSKTDVSGTERMAAAGMAALLDSEFEMPYRETMDPDRVDVPKTRRLVYLGRQYNIVRAVMAPAPDGKAIRLITSTTTATPQVEG